MAITRFEDLPSTNSPINSENLNGNFDELGVKVGTSVDNNYRTNIIKGLNGNASIVVDGEEIYSKGAVLYDGGTAGSDLSSPISFNDSLANYERIEIYYGTTRPYYISNLYSNYGQHTYFEPSLQFYYPSNADSSFDIYITLLDISQNAMKLHSTRGSRTVTVSSSGAIKNTRSTTSSTIKIFKVIGYK